MTAARTEELDPHEVRFRLDSVQCGAWVSFVVCLSALAYIAFYADSEDQADLTALTVAALVGSFATLRLPWEQVRLPLALARARVPGLDDRRLRADRGDGDHRRRR